MKKILLFIAFAIFGLGLNAQSVTVDYDGYSLKFSVSNGKCYVSGYSGTPTDVTIPSSVEISGTEYSVTSIGNSAFSECSSLESIEIPSSVTSIGDGAFYNCSSLESVTFGENSQLTSIGKMAFAYCSSLESIEIPSSVTSIGDYAFCWCESLASVTFGENSQLTSIGNSAFSYCSNLEIIQIPSSVTSIGNSAFYSCSSLESIEIPSSVTSIGEMAFYFCSSLESIEIPSSVTSIGDYAFRSCSSLESIEIPSSVTSIEEGAFNGCSSLAIIEIPSSVTSIGEEAFSYCSSLKMIKCYAENIPETGDNVFSGCPSDMTIYVPEVSLEDYKATYPWNNYVIFPQKSVAGYIELVNCGGYFLSFTITSVEPAECEVRCVSQPATGTTLTIPENVLINETWFSVTSIPDSAFLGCDKFIGDLVIPNTVTSVGIRAFRDCTGFTGSLTLSENLKTIGDLAFAGGGDIIVNYTGGLTIPNSVTYIGLAAFQNCSSLENVTFGENSQLDYIGQSAFLNCSSLTGDLTIPNSVTSIGEAAFQNCSSLENVTFGENSQLDYIGQWAFLNCSSLTGDLTIPNSVTYIGESAFWECVGLDGILTLPENLDTIRGYTFGSYDGYMAFTGNVVIPESVKYIGEAAFQNCSSLENVTFGENSQLDYIGQWAFIVCNSLTSIEIPSGVTYIGNYGLSGSKLRNIICYAEDVPETGNNAFYLCPSDMTIYVPEVSLEDYKATYPWNQFTILPLEEEDENPTPTVPAALDTLFAEALNDTTVVLTWNAVDSVSGYNVYSVTDSTYTLLTDSISDTTFTVKGLVADSTYCFSVAAFNEAGESERKSVTVTTPEAEDDGNDNPTDTIVPTPTPEPLDAPENLVATPVSTSSIILTWNVVENAESYNVYRDGEFLTDVTNPTYTDKDLEYNTKYCYEVTAVRGNEESDESNQECVKTLGEGVEELSSSFEIYPNPVENELFLATELHVEEIAIYDIYGRQTLSQQVNESTSQQVINVAELNSGIYFVKVVTSEGEIVKRFVKK